jgi:hypothetical protein
LSEFDLLIVEKKICKICQCIFNFFPFPLLGRVVSLHGCYIPHYNMRKITQTKLLHLETQNYDLRSLILNDHKFRELCAFKWWQHFMCIMESVDEYARPWTNSAGEELGTLSEWIKGIRKLLIIYRVYVHYLSLSL